MSSLIEVLKVIQEEKDLDSRTEAHVVFDRRSASFEADMAVAFEAGFDQVKALAAADMLMAEYWMNQWVGSDPKWHGDWGKVLRAAVREIKSGDSLADEVRAENRARQQQDVGETAPGEATVEQGTVRSGRYEFPATRSLDGEVLYTTRLGTKTANDRIAKTFKRA